MVYLEKDTEHLDKNWPNIVQVKKKPKFFLKIKRGRDMRKRSANNDEESPNPNEILAFQAPVRSFFHSHIRKTVCGKWRQPWIEEEYRSNSERKHAEGGS